MRSIYHHSANLVEGKSQFPLHRVSNPGKTTITYSKKSIIKFYWCWILFLNYRTLLFVYSRVPIWIIECICACAMTYCLPAKQWIILKVLKQVDTVNMAQCCTQWERRFSSYQSRWAELLQFWCCMTHGA